MTLRRCAAAMLAAPILALAVLALTVPAEAGWERGSEGGYGQGPGYGRPGFGYRFHPTPGMEAGHPWGHGGYYPAPVYRPAPGSGYGPLPGCVGLYGFVCR